MYRLYLRVNSGSNYRPVWETIYWGFYASYGEACEAGHSIKLNNKYNVFSYSITEW